MFLLLLAVLASSASADVSFPEVDRCTSILVGAHAGTQGPMTTHTADCSDCDFRINKTPSQDHKEGSVRKLYVYKGMLVAAALLYAGCDCRTAEFFSTTPRYSIFHSVFSANTLVRSH